MKLICVIPILVALASAEAGADISLTLVNDWVTADQVLGVDYSHSGASSRLLAVCGQSSLIRVYDPLTGQPTGETVPLDPDNEYPWGVVWNELPAGEIIFANDMTQGNLYCTVDSGQTWTTSANPSGGAGRGLDFDGTDYWSDEAGGLWCFQPGGAQQLYNTTEIPTPPSGLTVFPYGTNLGIAVTAYTTHLIYFYEWDGTEISYIGSTDCPVAGITTSFGLAYSDNGNIFWTYKTGSSEYHLAEISFSILALEQSSWGCIKASF